MMSSSPKAKFAQRSPSPPSALTQAEKHAFAFAEELRKLAVGIVDAAIAEVAFEGERDPKLYGLALLCRSISNFQGALTMARLDQAVKIERWSAPVWRTSFWSINFSDMGRDM